MDRYTHKEVRKRLYEFASKNKKAGLLTRHLRRYSFQGLSDGLGTQRVEMLHHALCIGANAGE